MPYQWLCVAASLGLLMPNSSAIAERCQASPAAVSQSVSSSDWGVMVPVESAAADKAVSQDYLNQLLQLTNMERQQVGLSPLRLSSTLNQAAQRHAEDLVRSGQFSHTGSDGSQPSDRALAAGYRYSYIGENIAAGSPTPAQTIQQWMNSSGHRSNLLKREFTDVGFGYVSDPAAPYRYYWVQILGRPL